MFKACCCRVWEEWLVDLLKETNEVRDATCEEVSEWTSLVFWEMVGSCVLRNAWQKTGYDWFPGFVDPEDVVAAENERDEDDGWDGNDGGDYEDNDESYAYVLVFDRDKEEKGEESDYGDTMVDGGGVA